VAEAAAQRMQCERWNAPDDYRIAFCGPEEKFIEYWPFLHRTYLESWQFALV
jgi:hypothetical protein